MLRSARAAARPTDIACALAMASAAGCASLEETHAESESRVQSLLDERMEGCERLAELGRGLDGTGLEVLLAGGLTLEEAVQLALVHSPTLRAELAPLGVAAADLVRAGLIGNPVLDVDSRVFDGRTDLEGRLALPLFDLFLRPARQRAAAAELRVVEARVASAILASVFDVRRAAIELLAAQRVADTLAEAARAGRAASALMDELHRAGNVLRDELSRLQMAEARVRLTHSAAQARVREARAAMALLLGLEAERDWTLAVEWEAIAPTFPHPDDAGERAQERSLALAEIAARADALAERAGLASREAWSEGLAVGLSFAREGGSDEWGLGPGASVPIPLLDTGAASVRAARFELEGVLARQAGLRRTVRSAAARLTWRVEDLEAELQILTQHELPAAERFVEDTLRGYNAMQTGAFDVLDARAREVDAARRVVEARRLLALARTDLAELLAGRLNADRVAAGTRSSSETLTDPGTSAGTSTGGH